MYPKFCLEYIKEVFYLEDTHLDRRMILKCILKKWWDGVDWFHLAQDRDTGMSS
jgi:hypothetical protein